MGKPLVSFLIVAHDAEKTLGFALGSVLAQTVEDWECIVVDDGSARAVDSIVESFADPRFRHLRLDKNRGRGYARRESVNAASGQLLAMLDADDWTYPTRLEEQIGALTRRPDAHLAACSLAVEGPDHRVRGVIDVQASMEASRSRLPVAFASILIRAEAARRIGFDVRLERAEDVLFLRQALREPWTAVPTPLYAYYPSRSTRVAAIQAHRASRLAYSQCRSDNPFLARRIDFSYRAREVVHTLVPDALSRHLTEWARARVLRVATDVERAAHRLALETVTRVASSVGHPP